MNTFIDGFKHNFQLLIDAARTNDLAILEVRDRVTGELACGIVAVDRDEEHINFVPLGTMCESNPYELFDPPIIPGGFRDHGVKAEEVQLVAQLHKAEAQVHMLRMKLGLPKPIFPRREEESCG